MILTPRYEGPIIVAMDGESGDQLEPFRRQRLRMSADLAELTEDEWAAPSRCDQWSVRDVVSHLATTDSFWRASILAGISGSPTRFLAGFDPVATPAALVAASSELTSQQVLDSFVSTTGSLIEVLSALSEQDWTAIAESPAGHVPVRVLVQHGLWDGWIHERDVAVPLGRMTAIEPDELRSCLRFAAALGPVLGIGLANSPKGLYAVEATDPDTRFMVEVADVVTVTNQRDGSIGVPCLRGDTVALIEGLSLRAPMPDGVPVEWMRLLSCLEVVFDAG